MPTNANTPDQLSDRYARYIQVGPTPATDLSRWVHPNGTTKSHPPPSIVKALTPSQLADTPSSALPHNHAHLGRARFIGSKSRPMLQATSGYFEWLANQSPKVLQFRDEVLGGKTLSLEQADKLLGSYAARFFPLEWFSDWRIPVVGHTSEIVREYDWGSHEQEVDHRVTLRVDPPGVTKRVRYAHPDTPILDEDAKQISSRCVLMKKRGSVAPPYNMGLPEDPDYETPNRPM